MERVPVVCEPNAANERYLNTKRERMGHLLDENMFKKCMPPEE